MTTATVRMMVIRIIIISTYIVQFVHRIVIIIIKLTIILLIISVSINDTF